MVSLTIVYRVQVNGMIYEQVVVNCQNDGNLVEIMVHFTFDVVFLLVLSDRVTVRNQIVIEIFVKLAVEVPIGKPNCYLSILVPLDLLVLCV